MSDFRSAMGSFMAKEIGLLVLWAALGFGAIGAGAYHLLKTPGTPTRLAPSRLAPFRWAPLRSAPYAPLPKISIGRAKGKIVGYMVRLPFGFSAWNEADDICKYHPNGRGQHYTIREFQGTLTLHKAKCPPAVEKIGLQEIE